MNTEVDIYLENTKRWTEELTLLRSIILDCDLTEELKWKNPCYTYKNSNILMLGEFKEYCALSFFKGVLLKDSESLLHSPGENSQSVKLFKFTSAKEINDLISTIKAYIFEAIEIDKAGLKVKTKDPSDLVIPVELENKFTESQDLKEAFYSLTPGRQRGYVLYFSSAKQSKTREERIEKYKQRILDGIGFHDCVCGLSKRMPNCDGSHKQLQN